MTTSAEPSLYESLGGEAAITAAVDGFYERVLADPKLAPFFGETRMERLKEQQRRFFAQALGGPQQYTGRPMRTAHAGKGITDEHFDSVAQHLIATLTALGVPEGKVTEVIGHIAPLRSDIVGV